MAYITSCCITGLYTLSNSGEISSLWSITSSMRGISQNGEKGGRLCMYVTSAKGGGGGGGCGDCLLCPSPDAGTLLGVHSICQTLGQTQRQIDYQ